MGVYRVQHGLSNVCVLSETADVYKLFNPCHGPSTLQFALWTNLQQAEQKATRRVDVKQGKHADLSGIPRDGTMTLLL